VVILRYGGAWLYYGMVVRGYITVWWCVVILRYGGAWLYYGMVVRGYITVSWKVTPCRLIHYCYRLGGNLFPSATLNTEAR